MVVWRALLTEAVLCTSPGTHLLRPGTCCVLTSALGDESFLYQVHILVNCS